VKRKTLHIRSSFNIGGTETLLLNLFNHEQELIEFHLVLIRGGDLVERLRSASNKAYTLYRNRFIDIGVIRQINRIIRNEKIEIVHAHQEIELLYAVLLKCINPGLRIFYTIHLTNSRCDFAFFLDKVLIRFCEKIITVSDSLKQHLVSRGYPAKKLLTLFNAVKLSGNALSPAEIETIESQIDHRPSDYIIMMTGNFRPEKDHLTVVRAFNLLRNKLPFLKLIFIGKQSDEYFNCLNITDKVDLNVRVFYLGAVSDAWKYLPFADLFVFSSHSETFGLAVVEAMLMKTPVLASDIPVMQELFGKGKHFKLFPAGNAEALATGIESSVLEKSKETFGKSLENTCLYASENFSFDRYVQQLDMIYQASQAEDS
jgi:glycosyltransferase involved in cell wall biosynthesis